VTVSQRQSWVALLSQCCDIDQKNADKRPRIAVAPLGKLEKRMDAATLVAEQSRAIQAVVRSYINYYVYAGRPEWDGTDMAVDFTTIFHIPAKALVGVEKTCELTVFARQGLRERLMAHFGRIPDDDEVILMANKWGEGAVTGSEAGGPIPVGDRAVILPPRSEPSEPAEVPPSRQEPGQQTEDTNTPKG
jgi:hypothetical protein